MIGATDEGPPGRDPMKTGRLALLLMLAPLVHSCGATGPQHETITVSCVRWIVEDIGYCPGVRAKEDAGWQCDRVNDTFSRIYYECRREI